jgi:ribonuclease Z
MRFRPSVTAASVLVVWLAPLSAVAQGLTVTLLGTGNPEPSTERAGPATLVEAGGQRFVFDIGRGTAERLWQVAIPLGQINQILLTHLHSDHVVGLPDVWLSGWQRTRFGQRRSPLLVTGPPGTAAMTAALRQAYVEDVRHRTAAGRLADSATALVGHDTRVGLVYDRDGVKITAFAVDHGNPPIPAYGYRLEFGGRSVVISGDTRPSENLVRFAKGADVLVHEVMAAFPDAAGGERVRQLLSSHTSPEEAADIFVKVAPKLAVYTHVSLVTTPEKRTALLGTIIPRTRSVYAGPLEIGEDLMTIEVTDTVRVRRKGNRH